MKTTAINAAKLLDGLTVEQQVLIRRSVEYLRGDPQKHPSQHLVEKMLRYLLEGVAKADKKKPKTPALKG